MSQHRVSPWAVAHLQRLGQLPLAQLEAGLVGGAVQQLPLLPPHDVHHVAVPAQRLGAASQNVVVCQKLICCLARSLHIESTMSRYRLCALALRHRKVKASNYSTRPAYRIHQVAVPAQRLGAAPQGMLNCHIPKLYFRRRHIDMPL